MTIDTAPPITGGAFRGERGSLGPNARLVGRPGSRDLLATPCLVLDRRALQKNIAIGAEEARRQGLALRPHAKSHKCSQLALLQIEAGASGVCVATVGEAEAMAAGGVRDILVTSTITQPSKMDRLAALAASGVEIAAVADAPEMAVALASACRARGVEIGVHVDIDLGRKRNGVNSIEGALEVAAAIASAEGIRLAGAQAYASHISHVESYADRLAASRQCASAIEGYVAALLAAGHGVETVTGGSTGTLFIDGGLGCYRELQCGSYVFDDVEYGRVDLDGNGRAILEPSLFVRVSVIGRNVAGRVTCDGGNKQFSAKGTLPTFRAAPVPGAVYTPDSDEHGIITLPDGAEQPRLGAAFELVVPHCDPTVNLYDHYHVVEDDMLVDIWRIEARGAF